MAAERATLRGISEIRAYFRTNPTPVYFVSPTPFNLLGIDRWLRNFFYVSYYDSFEGTHPRVFAPQDRPHTRVRVHGGDLHLSPARTRRCSSGSGAAAPAARPCS